jgi:hypothetical protein
VKRAIVIGGAVAIVIAAVGLTIAIAARQHSLSAAAAGLPPGTSRAELYANILAFYNGQQPSKAASVNCVLPAHWVVGVEFDCAFFNGSGGTLNTYGVDVQIPPPGDNYSYRFDYDPIGG